MWDTAKPGKACLYNMFNYGGAWQIYCSLWSRNDDEDHLSGRESSGEQRENVKDVEQYISRIDEMIERKEKLLSDR